MNGKRSKNKNSYLFLPIDNTDFDYSSFNMWVLIDSTHFAIARSRFLEIAQYGLTKEQAQVLYVLLASGGSATQAQIAYITMRQHHSVSTLVNRMCKDGLVRKVKEPKGKMFRVSITKRGRNRYEKLTRDSVEMIFSALSSEDRQKLASYLNQLQTRARSLLGLDYRPPFLKS